MEPEALYEEDGRKIAEREAYIVAHPEESEHPIENEEPTDLTVEVPTNPSCWRKTQKHVAGLVNSSAFETLITLCILFNTLAMALEHFEMDKDFAKVLEICNLVRTFFYLHRMFQAWGDHELLQRMRGYFSSDLSGSRDMSRDFLMFPHVLGSRDKAYL